MLSPVLPRLLLFLLGLGIASGPLPALPMKVGFEYARANGIRISRYSRRHIGDPTRAAPIVATPDGGLLIVGTRDRKNYASVPVIVRLNANGDPLWTKSPRRKGLAAFEGESAIRVDSGGRAGANAKEAYFIFIQAYVHPARGGKTWLVKLNGRGRVLCQKLFRGGGSFDTPYTGEIKIGSRGGIELTGHIYPASIDWRKERAHDWHARVDGACRVQSQATGQPWEKRKRKKSSNRS